MTCCFTENHVRLGGQAKRLDTNCLDLLRADKEMRDRENWFRGGPRQVAPRGTAYNTVQPVQSFKTNMNRPYNRGSLLTEEQEYDQSRYRQLQVTSAHETQEGVLVDNKKYVGVTMLEERDLKHFNDPANAGCLGIQNLPGEFPEYQSKTGLPYSQSERPRTQNGVKIGHRAFGGQRKNG